MPLLHLLHQRPSTIAPPSSLISLHPLSSEISLSPSLQPPCFSSSYPSIPPYVPSSPHQLRLSISAYTSLTCPTSPFPASLLTSPSISRRLVPLAPNFVAPLYHLPLPLPFQHPFIAALSLPIVPVALNRAPCQNLSQHPLRRPPKIPSRVAEFNLRPNEFTPPPPPPTSNRRIHSPASNVGLTGSLLSSRESLYRR